MGWGQVSNCRNKGSAVSLDQNTEHIAKLPTYLCYSEDEQQHIISISILIMEVDSTP